MRVFPTLCLFAAVVVATTQAPDACAQAAANRPLSILVPVPAGGTSDTVARLIGEHLKEAWARIVVIENKPGANGRIAVDALRNAPHDGTTILVAPIAIPVIGPLVFDDLRYDPARDLVPVTQVSQYSFAFAVAPDHPARNLSEFVAWAKANPERASVGGVGTGTLPHFLAVMLAKKAGIEPFYIAYKGAGAAASDVIGDQISAVMGALSDLITLNRAGRLRIIATSGASRAAILPDVPTFRELGYPSLEAVGWHGVFAPAGTPQRVITRLSGEIAAAMHSREIKERIEPLGLEPTGTTAEALKSMMTADTARWRSIIKKAGFRGE